MQNSKQPAVFHCRRYIKSSVCFTNLLSFTRDYISSLFYITDNNMAHYTTELKQSKNSLFHYNMKEIDHLRVYVQCKLHEKNDEEALKALSSAIALNNQILYRCALSDKKREKLMKEGMVDMKAYEQISQYLKKNPKPKEMQKKPEAGNSIQLWTPNPNLPSADAVEGFKRFSGNLTLPTKDSSRWDKIIGHEATKKFIEAAITYPMLFQSLYQHERVARGVLLYGPPGTGKTMLASAIAAKIGLPFLELKGSDMMSKWLGQTEENIRYFFALAQHMAPCVLFLDEVDSMAGQRDGGGDAPESTRSITNQLLTSMDSAKGIFVVGATNFPWQIDSAFARRLTKKIFIPLPTAEERMQCIRKKLDTIHHNLLEIDIEAMNDKLSYASNDDILKWLDAIIVEKKAEKLIRCRFFAKTNKGIWFPTTKMNPKAVQTSYLELQAKGENVTETHFTLFDFESAKPEITSNEESIKKYKEFKECLTDPSKKFKKDKKLPDIYE